MKKTILTILIIYCAIAIKAQTNVLLPIEMNWKWGAVDSLGNIAIPIKYDLVKTSQDFQFAIVYQNDKQGVLNSENEIVVPIEYSEVRFISQNLILGIDSQLTIYHTNKGKLFDNQFVSYKYHYNSIFSFCSRDSLYTVVDPVFDNILQINVDTINEQYAINSKNYYKFEIDKKQGIFNSNLEIILKADYDNIRLIGKNKFLIKKNKKFGLLDTTGAIILALVYDSIYQYKKKFFKIKLDDKLGITNSDGKILINPEMDKINYKYRNFMISQNNRLGVYDTTGKTIIKPEYESLSKAKKYWHGKRGDAVVFMDSKFRTIIQQNCDGLKHIGDNFLRIKENNLYGIIDFNGKRKVSSNYRDADFITKDYFEIQGKNGYGVVDKNNKTIIKPGCSSISMPYGKIFVVERKNKYKLFNKQGLIQKTSFDNIYTFADDLLKVRKAKKYGVLDCSSKVIVPVKYSMIEYLSDLKLFRIRSNEVKQVGEDSTDVAYMYGLINRYGDLLLDTIFRFHKIKIDQYVNQIKAECDTAMIVVFCDEDGRFIDRTYYKRWVKVAEKTTKNVWKQNPLQKSNAWGLIDYRRQKLIDYKFVTLRSNWFADSNLVLTVNPRRKYKLLNKNRSMYQTQNTRIELRRSYGLVNEEKGKELLYNRYALINRKDFNDASVARCITTSRKFQLINENGIKINKTYSYIDDFKQTYARINKGGYLSCQGVNSYNLEVPTFKKLNCLICERGRLHCNKGFWGVIDTMGNIIITPQYEFMQKYFNNTFIVKKSGKWGVININQDTLIDFIYERIEYFKNPFKPKEWIVSNYYKVRDNKKWGIVDLNGNEIIACKYDNVKMFVNETDTVFGLAIKRKIPKPSSRNVTQEYKVFYKWGLVNLSGDTIAPISFDSISFVLNKNTDLLKAVNNTPMMGYIDTSLNIVTEPLFIQAYPFKNNIARVMDNTFYYRFIDKTGNYISDNKYYEARDFSEDLAAVRYDENWFFINKQGEFAFDKDFYKVGDFTEGKTWVRFYKKKFLGLFGKVWHHGYIDKSGEFLFRPRYSYCSDFKNGYAKVKKGKKRFIIDANGKKQKNIENIVDTISSATVVSETIVNIPEFVNQRFSNISDFTDGLAIYTTQQIFGIYHLNGKTITKPKQVKIEKINNNIFKLQSLNGIEYIDASGNYLWNLKE